MNILVINSGSSSLKYQFIDMKNESVIAKGICDRIGLDNSILKHSKTGNDTIVIEKNMPNHISAINELVKALTDAKFGVISNMSEISAIGHRIVHGGEKFSGSVIIDQSVMQAVRECIDIAPLHNPPNIVGVEACMEIIPGTPMVGVFDTAFHQTIPDHAYLYALPYGLYQKYGIRKYGFHGTSHMYVSQRVPLLLNKSLAELKIITCHLGNGASVCAVKNGKSVETSMGFTPLAGLVMGTRSGTIDPAIIKFIMDKENISINEVDHLLNKKSGMLGISGISSDFRDIEAAAQEGNDRCRLAIDIFCYRVKKYIGEFSAVMGGLDALVFTAGIGENSDTVRKKSVEGLEYLGVVIDPEKNRIMGVESDISAPGAKVKTLIIPTNEELAIARETFMKLSRSK